ncbi:hypothetical protein Lgra_3356 [Legionella gratiana]|uniref:Uncharacterized protein n=1 Tax=Legionella gratiana TaxID=45066 RepID=A0A378JCW0_9GAMM|nr:hypothetical protein [Legionella gratiana]KTD06579.1 hypothetical protein Lgra_3356 [Legionella gratiana]STX44717.1 Uncharacterised protein [Legionella gratiana]
MKSKILKELSKNVSKGVEILVDKTVKRELSHELITRSQPTSKENERENIRSQPTSKENEQEMSHLKEDTSITSNNSSDEKNTTQVINENQNKGSSPYGSGAMWDRTFNSGYVSHDLSVINIDMNLESYIGKYKDLREVHNIDFSRKELEILDKMIIKFNGTEITDLNEKLALLMLSESIHDPKMLKEKLPNFKHQMKFKSNDYNDYQAIPLPKYNIQLRDELKEIRKIQKSSINNKQLRPIINESIKEARKSLGIKEKSSKFEYPIPEIFNEITTDKSKIITRQQVLKKNLPKSRKNPMIANQEIGKNDIQRRHYHYQSHFDNVNRRIYIPNHTVTNKLEQYFKKLEKVIEHAKNGIMGVDNESFKESFNHISWHSHDDFLQHHFHHFDHIIQGFRNCTFETSVDMVKSLGEKYLDYEEYCKKQNKQAVSYEDFIGELIKAAELQGLKLDPNVLTKDDIVLLPDTVNIYDFQYTSATRLLDEIEYRCPNALANSEKIKTKTTLVRFEGERGLEKFKEDKIGVFYSLGLPVCGLNGCKDVEIHPVQLAYLLNISVGPNHALLRDREKLANAYQYLQDKALGIKPDPKCENDYNSWMENYENPPDNGYNGYILTIEAQEGTELCHSKTTGGNGNPFADEVYFKEPPNNKNTDRTIEKFQDGCSYPIRDIDSGEVRQVKVNSNAPFLNISVVVPECKPTLVNKLCVSYGGTGDLTHENLVEIANKVEGINHEITRLQDSRGMNFY